MASECVLDALKHDDPSAERLGKWSDEFAAGTKWVRKLVHAFYSGEFRVGRFVKEYPHHAGPLTDLLVGKMFSPDVPALFADLDPWLEKAIAEGEATTPTSDGGDWRELDSPRSGSRTAESLSKRVAQVLEPGWRSHKRPHRCLDWHRPRQFGPPIRTRVALVACGDPGSRTGATQLNVSSAPPATRYCTHVRIQMTPLLQRCSQTP